jgi:hypothetical protein
MIAHARPGPVQVNQRDQVGSRETPRPATSASRSSATPMAEASSTRPGRRTFIHQPISRAMGIVQAMVKSPHGLALRAFTTTSASTASRMIMMARIAIIAAIPATGFTSSFAIWPKDLPFRRSDATRMVKSCTAPPRTTPTINQRVPGRKPNCAASVGPMSGPAPAIAAKWWPYRTHLFVGTKSRPLLRRSAGVARRPSRAKTRSAMYRE